MYGNLDYSTNIKLNLEQKEKLEKFVEFKYEDTRITDLINNIRNNEYIYVNNKKQTIQNALIKSDLTTIWIGMTEISYGLTKESKEDIYNYMDTLLLDIETLLEEVKKYSKEDIFFIGYYAYYDSDKIYIEYLNKKLEKLCEKEGINYIENVDNISDSILAKFTFS
jgi:hypothetical protein